MRLNLNRYVPRGKRAFWLAYGGLTAAYLAYRQDAFYYLAPAEVAGYDDGLQFRLATFISDGKWLGDYNQLTLAKGVVYPAWIAALHWLDIPLWLGNALLVILASAAVIFALRTVMVRRWLLLIVYAILLFHPMAIPRVYRDSIVPAVVLLVVAWVLGMFLVLTRSNRIDKILKENRFELIILTLIGVIGLPAWWFLREDSFWLLPLIVGGAVVTLGYLLYFAWKRKNNLRSILLVVGIMLMPVFATGAVGALISVINLNTYDRFVVNDYVSHDFESAYGALTRIKDDNPRVIVPITTEMRKDAYAVSPAFRELQSCLDNNGTGKCEGFRFNKRAYGEYEGGWFTWALRLAVEQRGYYDDAAESEAFYQRLAREINTACDTKKLDCIKGERASIAPVFNKRLIRPVLETIPTAATFFVTLEGVDDNVVIAEPYHPSREEMANYVNARYRPDQITDGAKFKLSMSEKIEAMYSFLNPIFLTVAITILLVSTIFIRKLGKYWREILISWALILAAMLRVVMIAYVDATSFPAILVIYFSSAYPLMFLFEAFTICVLIGAVIKKMTKSISYEKIG